MKSLKKLLSILLALFLTLSAAGPTAWAEETGETTGDEKEYPDELRVGHTTVTKGDFFTEMFGNDTSDIDVRALLHGYNLVNWDQNQGVYVFDESVVENVLTVVDEVGNKTYFIGLYDDLYYSDGTPITAWDYAFSLLLMMSPEIEQIGGKIYRAEHILGYDEYITGQLPYLTGVGVLDEHQLAITLDHNFLPYFFETGLMLCVPYPISEIAPGCRVYAGGAGDLGNGYGYGIRIGNADPSVQEPIYTAELLAETIMNPDTGYNSHPKVVSGPYTLTDYDYETAHFRINPYFKGAWVNNTLPETFRFDEESLGGTGSGSTAESHSGPNYIEMTREDPEGNEYTIYLVKPTIEKISFSLADNDTALEDLLSGKFHLINKMVYGPTIMELLGANTAATVEEEAAEGRLYGAEGNQSGAGSHTAGHAEKYAAGGTPEGNADTEPAEGTTGGEQAADHHPGEAHDGMTDDDHIRFQNYPRIGLSFLTFTFDWPTVHEKEVRQAIAWCMDREGLTEDYTSGLGKVVDGYFGIEQWEYLICDGQLQYPINFMGDETHTEEDLEEWKKHRNMYATTEEELEELEAAWKMLKLDNLTHYEVNLEKANALLDSAGWTLNRDGAAYRPGTDDVRCKQIDGELVALDLSLMYPEGNHIIDTLKERFLDNLAQAGIRVTLVPARMEDLLKSYYRETERTTDMIYLATNFHVIVDPAITYSTDRTANHRIWNNTYSDDEDLYYRAVNMRQTDPLDVYDYVSKWISFQERYNEVLPTIPIYSNLYFDFFTSQLQNYYITAHVTWSQAILESYFGEPPEIMTPSEAEAGDGEMIIEE